MISESFRKIIFIKHQGFTLIELLITIFLVSVGLIGVLAFFNSSLTSQFDAKNELIAAGLAQEGAELVRSIVDYNFLNNNPNGWYDELTNKDVSTVYCSSVDRDILLGDNFKCRTTQKKPEEICFNQTSGVYSQKKSCPGNQIETDFKRSLTISGYNLDGNGSIDLEKGDCLNIVATVGWPISNSACNASILNCPYKTVSTDIICKPRQ